jgi:hypothetical protein
MTTWTAELLIAALNQAGIEPDDLVQTLGRSKLVLDLRSAQAEMVRLLEAQTAANQDFELQKQAVQAKIDALDKTINENL